MTRDEVMLAASATGFGRTFPAQQGLPATWYGTDPDRLLAFAAKVAAAEREACAQLCDGLDAEVDQYPAACAAAIRARKD